MRKQPVLNTKRLILRPFEQTDIADIKKLAGDKRIADGTFMPHPYTLQMAEEFVRNSNYRWNKGTNISFAITTKKDKKLVGSISLKNINREHRHAEMGYWIGAPFWSKGYATEAGKSIIDFGFNEMSLQRIFANHFHTNPGSGRVLQKLGMTQEGTMRNHIIRFGAQRDLIIYGILKNEWQETKQPE